MNMIDLSIVMLMIVSAQRAVLPFGDVGGNVLLRLCCRVGSFLLIVDFWGVIVISGSGFCLVVFVFSLFWGLCRVWCRVILRLSLFLTTIVVRVLVGMKVCC